MLIGLLKKLELYIEIQQLYKRKMKIAQIGKHLNMSFNEMYF